MKTLKWPMILQLFMKAAGGRRRAKAGSVELCETKNRVILNHL
jgi:hypothetical protein